MKSGAQNTAFSINKTWNIKGRLIDLTKPHVMGILNVTPDSFYDGGRYLNESVILKQAEKMILEGTDFIDIGGYSSRPGAVDIPIEEELSRAVKAVALVHHNFPEVILSIDTFRSSVAKEALEAGASIINDISAGSLDQDMALIAQQFQAPYIIMHMRGDPQHMASLTQYDDLMLDILDYFQKKITYFKTIGVKDIVVDPGFGFAKTRSQNFALLHEMESLRILGQPILVGLSRKSMIWKTLKITPEEALNGTSALHTIALLKGASILRVHDVKEAREVIELVSLVREDKL